MTNRQIRLGDLLIDKKSRKRFCIVVGMSVTQTGLWILHLNGILENRKLLLPIYFVNENFEIEQSLSQ